LSTDSAPLLDPSLEDAARRERHRQRLARLFRHAQGQPGAQRLLALVCQYRGVETS
jgi:hypothetical protein